jgi:hypothetical protein
MYTTCFQGQLTEDAVAAGDAADEVHAVDLVGLGALLDDHREPAVHAVLARQQVAELLGSAVLDREEGWRSGER